jgi:hypothetical protein
MCDLLLYLKNATGNKEGSCGGGWVDLAQWNIMGTVCQNHWNLAAMFLETNNLRNLLNPNGTLINAGAYAPTYVYPAGYLQEYVALLCIMQSVPTCMNAISGLALEVSNSLKHHAGNPDDLDDRFQSIKTQSRDFVRLSRVLANYECYCFFRSNHVIFAGALSGGDFNFCLKQGLMPKDPGAGALHGDFSHRLQWHIVMRVITNNFHAPFTGNWQHSPFQLFCSLGAQPANQRRIWGAVFDAQGRPGFSDPSNLFSQVRRQFKDTPLGVRLIASYTKRRTLERECERLITHTLNQHFAGPVAQYVDSILFLAGHPNLHRCTASDVFNLLYQWKKMRNPVASNTIAFNVPNPVPPLTTAPPAHALAQWNQFIDQLITYVAAQLWELHIMDNTSNIGAFLRGSRNPTYLVERRLAGPMPAVLVADDGDRMHLINPDARATASANRFNDFYQYDPQTGCKRIN